MNAEEEVRIEAVNRYIRRNKPSNIYRECGWFLNGV